MKEIEVMDLAVIFTPFINEQNVLNYKATEVVEGYYEDNDDKFIDTNLFSYDHIINAERGKVFAFRTPINELVVKYPDKNLQEIKEILLKERENIIYFLGYYDDELFLFSKKPETGEITLEMDFDMSEFFGYLDEDSKLRKLILEKLKDSGMDLEEEDYEEIKKELPDVIMFRDPKDEKEEIAKPEEKEEVTKPELVEQENVNVNPHKLFKEIKKTVKGQDDAIKEIVTGIWENYTNEHSNNMILVGPSGTGKTEILRQLSKRIDAPLLITTVTGMSQAGYVGGGTDEILKNLLTLTKGDVEKAERAIVVLDEIDKLAYSGSESGKVSTDGVQNELLKIVEDGTFYVDINENGFPSKCKISTKNITFIGVGAFNGMLTTKTERHVGFGADITSKEITKDKIVPEDLIKYGIKPELVGRMGKIVKLNELDLPTMKDIIKNSDKSAYISKMNLINKMGIKLDTQLEDEIVEEIAKLAITKKIGARSINNIVTEMFSNILFDISNPEEQYSELEISKETVTNPKKYILRK